MLNLLKNLPWKRLNFSTVGQCFSRSGLFAMAMLALPQGSAPKPSGEAPRDGMFMGRWSSGVKQIFGSSYESYDSNNKYSAASSTAPISKLWFTGTQGIISEVFWPTLDTPQVRDLQFLITDGASFFQEERRLQSEVKWLHEGVPAYVVTTRDPANRYSIEKIIYTDPSSDALIVKVVIQQNIAGLKFYVLHNPSVGNSPLGDYAYARNGTMDEAGLFAFQGQEAQALVFSLPVLESSAAFSGPYDGFQDILKNYRMTHHYSTASNGEVVLTAHLDIPSVKGRTAFNMSLGFATNPEAAAAVGRQALSRVDSALQLYTEQWQDYQKPLENLAQASLDGGRLYRASVAVLKAMEDKTFEGAFVACPCIPWGEHNEDHNSGPLPSNDLKDRPRQNLVGGYHLVWPRDLYHMATTMMAIGDYASAIASLNRLRGSQLGPNDGYYPDWSFRKISKNGSWPQNFWANGEIWWTGLQMDEVAMPVVLAYRLWEAGKIELKDYWDMVSRAADLLQKYGPWTQQERWEETFGASPSTIASEISALWTAAHMAEAMGDWDRARVYRAEADKWAFKPGDNIDTWTFTTTGAHGNGHYYQRIEGASRYDQVWDPNDETHFWIGNNGGGHREKDITDGGFLELVRFGVRSPLDPKILETLPEYDATIRVDVAGFGPSFRRYLHDAYNYDDANGGQQTLGMPWPLLTGERAIYEVARSAELGHSSKQANDIVNPYVKAIENFATDSLMIPEQVWDYGARAGQVTGAATPLGWAHGEYIKVLRSKRDRYAFDHVNVVKLRAEKLKNMQWQQIEALTSKVAR